MDFSKISIIIFQIYQKKLIIKTSQSNFEILTLNKYKNNNNKKLKK